MKWDRPVDNLDSESSQRIEVELSVVDFSTVRRNKNVVRIPPSTEREPDSISCTCCISHQCRTGIPKKVDDKIILSPPDLPEKGNGPALFTIEDEDIIDEGIAFKNLTTRWLSEEVNLSVRKVLAEIPQHDCREKDITNGSELDNENSSHALKINHMLLIQMKKKVPLVLRDSNITLWF